MTFLRLKGIPVPEIYGYSATADNPAQAEYMFLEYGPGGNLGALWGGMDERDRQQFVKNLVKLESRLFSLLPSRSRHGL
jgi:hypothetical protein